MTEHKNTPSKKTIVNAAIPADRPGRALVVDGDKSSVESICEILKTWDVECDIVKTYQDALSLINKMNYDLVVIEQDIMGAHSSDFLVHIAQCNTYTRTVVMGSTPGFADAMTAIRQGAVDFLQKPLIGSEAGARLQHAITLAKQDRNKQARIRRLKRICQHLTTVRLDVASQVDVLCNNLVNAYENLTDQISQVTLVTEFGAIIRQELDVEEVLRTTLEFFLRKIGPMNAAVYLPSTSDEFTLGAYINYDIPKENSDFLLDYLADIIPQKMAAEKQVLEFKSNLALKNWIGDDATWLQDSHVVCFGCFHEGECLAIFTLFKDIETPFEENFPTIMSAMGEVFGQHLAQVIHVHHRHLPDIEEDDWLNYCGDDDSDSLDEDDFGFGDTDSGMAA